MSVGEEEEEEEEDPRPTSNAVLRVALTLCVILQVRDGDLGFFKIYFGFFSLVSSFVNLDFSLVWFGFISGSCEKNFQKYNSLHIEHLHD